MSNRKHRESLYKENPYCHYCDRKTIPPENFAKEERNPRDAPLMSTLEHLKTKWHTIGRRRAVIACAECNQTQQQRIDQKMQQKLKEKGVKQPSPRIARELGVTP